MRAAVRRDLGAPAPPVWLILTALTVLDLLVFGQILGHSFVAYDDGLFVYENAQVKRGLTSESVRWALTSAELGYYPLTWLSHMADVELYGMNAGGHLATALLLHILSTCVLFLALRSLTANTVNSAVVAALFAVHPMHVESVAWVSERKDTLSTLFGMLALAAYARFACTRSALHMVLVALAFAASLASKQMLVTLPFVLLLLDFWPLGRRDWSRAVIEKIPLFVLTAAAMSLAFLGQRNLQAIQAAMPLSDRIENALVAYVKYIGKLFWPTDLAALYPLTDVSFGDAALAALLLLAITALLFALRRSAPYLITGWLWFLGTLVPVIGIVQIGSQSMADRYTYVPYIGLFIAIVWAIPKRALVPAAAIVIAVCAFLAWKQASFWRNTESLFEHTLAVTGPNALAEYTLGQTLQLTDPDRALTHLRRAIEITESSTAAAGTPHAQAYVGVGTALLMKARAENDPAARTKLIDEATAAYERAIAIDPEGTASARRNLAVAASMRPRVLPAAPPDVRELNALIEDGVRRLNANDVDGAVNAFREAVRREPAAVAWRVYLALAYMKGNRNADAAAQLEEARRLDASRANDYVTKALRMTPDPANLDTTISRLRGGR